jgi:hypothetical protein
VCRIQHLDWRKRIRIPYWCSRKFSRYGCM